MDWTRAVFEFNIANGYEPPPFGTIIDPPAVIKLQRLRLMMEELGELSCAMHESNEEKIADSIVDLMYVVIGTAVAYGFAPLLNELFQEVHRSNMSKDFPKIADGRKGGIKGIFYAPPDLKSIIERYRKK